MSETVEEKLSSLVTLIFSMEVSIKIVEVNRSSQKIKIILEDLSEMAELYWNDNLDWIKEANLILGYAKFTIYSSIL